MSVKENNETCYYLEFSSVIVPPDKALVTFPNCFDCSTRDMKHLEL